MKPFNLFLPPVAFAVVLLSGCLQVKTHSTIDPVHVTVDVNVNVRVQQELDNVFGDLDAASTTLAAPRAAEK